MNLLPVAISGLLYLDELFLFLSNFFRPGFIASDIIVGLLSS